MSQGQTATPDSVEQAAVRRLIHELAELDGREIDIEQVSMIEEVDIAIEKVTELQNRVERLEKRMSDVQSAVKTPEEKEYENMSKHEKAAILRQSMLQTARSTNGKHAVKYKNVIAEFDGSPSPGHAYDIMRVAGNVDGFRYGEGPDGSKRLTCELTRVKDAE